MTGNERVALVQKLIGEIKDISKNGILPDGYGVTISVMLWAEGWWDRFDPKEYNAYLKGKTMKREIVHCLDCKHVAKCSTEQPCKKCRWGGGKANGPLMWKKSKTETDIKKAARKSHLELPDERCCYCKHQMVLLSKEPCCKCSHMNFDNLKNKQSYYEDRKETTI
jgi:hypothetical protein